MKLFDHKQAVDKENSVLKRLNLKNVRVKKVNTDPATEDSKGIFKAQRNFFKKMRRYIRSYWHRIMSLEGAAMNLAIPIAFAIALAFVPTFGLGAPLCFVFAWVFKVSKGACVITSVAVTPIVPLFYALDIFISGLFQKGNLKVEDLEHAGEAIGEALDIVQNEPLIKPSSILSMGGHVFITSIFVAIVVFFILFPLFYKTIKLYQKKRLRRINKMKEKGLDGTIRLPRILLRKHKLLKKGAVFRIVKVDSDCG